MDFEGSYECPQCHTGSMTGCDFVGLTALHMACRHPNNVKVVEALLKSGAKVHFTFPYVCVQKAWVHIF